MKMNDIQKIVPKHVWKFIATKNTPIGKGIESISQLKTEKDFLKTDEMLTKTEKTAQILRGFLYMHYRQVCDGRTFAQFLAKRGIPRSTAYDYMDQARIYAELPSADLCEAVDQLGPVKIRLLSRLETDERNSFLNGEKVMDINPDEAADMSNADFKDHITKHLNSVNSQLSTVQNKLKKMKTQMETVEAERDAALLTLENRHADTTSAPDFYLIARAESRSLTEKTQLCLDDLEVLSIENLDHLSSNKRGELKVYAETSMATIYNHIKATASRFVALERMLVESLPEKITGTMQDELAYTKEEVEISVSRHKAMIDEHETQKLIKKDQRKKSKK
jgi:hypothetical protein